MSDTSNFKVLAFVRNCIIVILVISMVECIYSTIRDENRESQAFAFSKKASICLSPS